MGVAISFDTLDQMLVTHAINVAVGGGEDLSGQASPFAIRAVAPCPRCGTLAFESVDGRLVACRICEGRGAITLSFESLEPPPESYIDRRKLIRAQLERMRS